MLEKLNLFFMPEDDANATAGEEQNQELTSTQNEETEKDGKTEKIIFSPKTLSDRLSRAEKKAIDNFKTTEEWKNYEKFLETQKTEDEKTQEKFKNYEARIAQLEQENIVAQKNSILLQNGAKSETLKDLNILINSRINDDVSFEQALLEVKQSYSNFFNTGNQTPKTQNTGVPMQKTNVEDLTGWEKILAEKHPNYKKY